MVNYNLLLQWLPVLLSVLVFEVPLHKLRPASLLGLFKISALWVSRACLPPSLAKIFSIDIFVVVVAISGHWLETCSSCCSSFIDCSHSIHVIVCERRSFVV